MDDSAIAQNPDIVQAFFGCMETVQFSGKAHKTIDDHLFFAGRGSFSGDFLRPATGRVDCSFRLCYIFPYITRKIFSRLCVHVSCTSRLSRLQYKLTKFDLQATLINRTSSKVELAEAKEALIQSHGRTILRAVLNGFAGIAPRSAMPNLIELLSSMISNCLQQCRVWIPEILFDVSRISLRADS